eukprot:g41012.t1
MRRKFLSQRLVNRWNSLPQKAAEAQSLSIFKTEIDRFLIVKVIKGYGEKVAEWVYKTRGQVAKKSAKKAVNTLPVKSSKRRKNSRKGSYSIHIYKVMKHVHPYTGISSKAMNIMNSCINEIFEHIMGKASSLVHYVKRNTFGSREIQTILPRKLAKYTSSKWNTT